MNAKSCTWEGITPCTSTGWSLTGRQLCRDGLGDAGGQNGKNLNMIQEHAFLAKKADSLQGCVRKSIASSSRELILPLYSARVKHI